MFEFEEILILIAKTLGVICFLAFTVFFVFEVVLFISTASI